MTSLQDRISANVESLPTTIQRRLNGLKYYQSQHGELEGKFLEEVLALEKKYLGLYQPLYEKRSDIINGTYEPTDEEVALGEKADDKKKDDKKGEDDDKDKKKEASTASINEDKKKTTTNLDEEEEESLNGIPDFWLTIFKNHPQIEGIISAQDELALKHLTDVRMTYMEQPGFQLEFLFSKNDYFSNSVLTKTYYYQDLAYGSNIIYDHAKGCKIDWFEGKDLTVTTKSKKQKHRGTNKTRVVKRTVPTDSFFNFFSPPSLPDDSKELNDDEAEELDIDFEADYELGEEFKDGIIPHAVDYYTGKAYENEDFGDVDDDFEDDFYDEEEDEEEDDEDDEEDDDDNDVAHLKKGENAPECKQS
ncbi:unnamed protein product [Cunninghamella echinulata]